MKKLDSTTAFEINKGIEFYKHCVGLNQEMIFFRLNFHKNKFTKEEREIYVKVTSGDYQNRVNCVIKEAGKYANVSEIVEIKEMVVQSLERLIEEYHKEVVETNK